VPDVIAAAENFLCEYASWQRGVAAWRDVQLARGYYLYTRAAALFDFYAGTYKRTVENYYKGI
jgi:hypothetical protein